MSGNYNTIALNYEGSAEGESTPAGLSIAITPFTGGTGAPSLSGLAALLGDQNFDFIVAPWTDPTSLTALAALMNDSTGRWSDISQAFGHVWTARADTLGNLITFGDEENCQHITTFGVSGSLSPPWEMAAAFCGACAAALRAAPARPVQTLPVQGLLAPPAGSRFTKNQRQSLLTNGVATVNWGDEGGCTIERAVTQYQLNSFGQADQSYLDTETLYTLMAVTRTLAQDITQKFARCSLADDGVAYGPGTAIVTPSIVRAELVAEYAGMVNDGLVEDAAAFAAGLVVQRNRSDPSRLDVLYDPYLVGGLRIFAVLNQFRLNSATA